VVNNDTLSVVGLNHTNFLDAEQ